MQNFLTFYVVYENMKINEIQIFITYIVFHRIETRERMNLVPQAASQKQIAN